MSERDRIIKELKDKNPKEIQEFPTGSLFIFDKPILITSAKVNDGEVFDKVGVKQHEIGLFGTYCYARIIQEPEFKTVKIH